jgi:Xaa-Pro dipeptidase
MTAPMDFERARHLMRERGLDALLLCSPENFFYATGCSAMLLWLYRQAPLGMALVPARAEVERAVLMPAPYAEQARAEGVEDVYGIPVWFDPVTVFDFTEGATLPEVNPAALPEQYDRLDTCQQVAQRLRARGLAGGRIGMDLDFVDANTLAILQRENPDATFVDASDLLYQLRAIKSPAEIAALRKAAMVTAAGISAAGLGATRKSTLASLMEAFAAGVWDAARREGIAAELGSVDGQPTLGYPPDTLPPGADLPDGTTVKFDMQVSVGHYYSDLGRTYVLGGATKTQSRLCQTLVEAHERAREALRPGRPVSEVYEAARGALDRAGLRAHRRGQFGHSVGLDRKIEEPPFLSSASAWLLQPGMALTVETPLYGRGFGGFQLEDMCLVTESGYELLNDLPHGLQVVAV